MINFEKALEAAAQKEFDRWCAEKFSGTPKNWPLKEDIAEHFINWSRQFTVAEVIAYVSDECECSLDKKCIACAIEQHFKDRGGE